MRTKKADGEEFLHGGGVEEAPFIAEIGHHRHCHTDHNLPDVAWEQIGS